ncbi:DNA replication and repair protein RecF [Bacteroidetes/Chlorobi group bacterium MS-B_bin-24]|jgi:DNA replication and repair protein RecF|nr:MAG: DNA replication and repair protein RecF [Bacteroidetes/Chlorobi group bacterium MS-B_bin-24]
MYLLRLNFENIRNHNITELFPSKNINVIFGRNGSGKTSILEAISTGAFSKSFVTSFDQNIVQNGKDYYLVEIEARSENGLPIGLQVLYQLNRKKEIKTTAGENLSVQELIGKVPVVVLSPEMREIIFGAPSMRREFIDRIISQTDANYLKSLLLHRRILKQRNKLLNEFQLGITNDTDLLKIWTLKFIEISAEVVSRRLRFFEHFPLFFERSYQILSNNQESINITYQPFEFPSNLASLSHSDILEILKSQADKYFDKEIQRGITLFGPQKDDFLILLNNQLARNVASQGQSKTILISLKHAEMNYLYEMRKTYPIVLFDDIFSELDNERITQVLKILSDTSVQFFLTTTEVDWLKKSLPGSSLVKSFYVESGKVSEVSLSVL